MTPEEMAALVAAGIKAMGGIGGSSDNTKTSTANVIKLTRASAKQILTQIATEIQFSGKFNNADLDAFVKDYEKNANAQLETVIRDARSKLGSKSTPEQIAQTINDIVTTTYPSFFNPKQFTQDWLWNRTNFGKQESLGGKALDALATARGIAKEFNISKISDIEIETAAKQIASGKMTAEEYKAKLALDAAKDYPQLADRFKNTPGATTRSLNLPLLKIVADAWEVSVDSLSLDDPFIDSLIRPDGVTGKVAPKTPAEVQIAAMNHPNRDKTIAANTQARSAATSLARALGYGI